MKFLKTLFTIVGGFVTIFYILAVFNIGNFTMIYGPEKVNCIKESK